MGVIGCNLGGIDVMGLCRLDVDQFDLFRMNNGVFSIADRTCLQCLTTRLCGSTETIISLDLTRLPSEQYLK